ncbi:MAG: prepilin-type N-terminal cleavage/methylation domain-containing protein [Candidatus Sumerlaeia bacterium]
MKRDFATTFRRRRAFVLLEVLVSLAIMGVALSMILRSFSLSIRATEQSRKFTTASLLAQNLLDKWEEDPPDRGFTSENLEAPYARFHYEVQYEHEVLDYDNVSRFEETANLAPLRRVSLSMYYTSPRDKRLGKSQRLLSVETALSSSEKFTSDARRENEIDFDR